MKIYVDSRHRTSGTNEDFVWQIPESVEIPDSQCYIDCVLVPNVFFSVNDANNEVSFVESVQTTTGGALTEHVRVATIASGQYNGFTLATAVQTAMQTVSSFQTSLRVVFQPNTAKLQVDLSGGAWFNSEIRIYPDGLASASENEVSAGKVCGFLGTALIVGSLTSQTAGLGLGDSVIDVQRHHCCYIHSDLGDPGSSFGCRGESDVIRRVVVDATQNSLAVDRHTTSWDNVDVGARTLRAMEFRLAGDDGKTVDLHGHHWSFSLVFHDKL